MKDRPSSFRISSGQGKPSFSDNLVWRTLSWMEGQFNDQQSYQELLEKGDQVVYEVYEMKRRSSLGELSHGISIVHPGRVGDEYFKTKGHFHSVIDTAEVYYCLQGKGVLVMETLQGDWAVEEMQPGVVVYVPPGWAHRCVNVDGTSDLVTFFVYPSHAGHDYASIESRGFRKMIVDRDGKYEIVDNPNWGAGGEG